MNIKKTEANFHIFGLYEQIKEHAKFYLVVRDKKLCIVDDENLSEKDVKIQPEEVNWC